MKVTGFTIVRNAIIYDYPIVEAISSILPVCDEFVVAVGRSEDDTLALIQSIDSPKIRIIETDWDMTLREGGKVLAEETNKALDAIDSETDWCFYIQGDEVMHEKYIDTVREAMHQHLNNFKVEGLLFNYVHFYGSYDYIGDSRKWYRKEIRIIRNDKNIRSYRDAQGFRKADKKLQVKETGAEMYHYGWVKPPEKQLLKQKNFHKMWHSDEEVERKIGDANTFDYSNIDSLALFEGVHPNVMQERIRKTNWSFSYDISKTNLTCKAKALKMIEKTTGWRIGEYKNYKLL